MADAPRDRLEFQTVEAANVDALADGLAALHLAVRGERRGPRYWRWCYVDHPMGSVGSAVALRADRVVGKIGIVPVQFVMGGRRIAAGLYEGLHVLPSDRSWPCYRGLIEKGILASAAGRLAFGYAFVNRAGIQLSARTGSERLGRVPYSVCVLDVARALQGRSVPYALSLAGRLFQPWLAVRRPRNRQADLDIRPIGRFDAAFDDLWRGLERARTVSAVRDADYLNWRYVRCPGREYTRLAAFRRTSRDHRLEGLVVFRNRPRRRDAFVVELLARNDDALVLQALLTEALDVLARRGAGLAAASFPARSAEAVAARKLGFLPWAGPILGIELVLSPGVAPTPGPAGHLPNWYFSLGDWLTY